MKCLTTSQDKCSKSKRPLRFTASWESKDNAWVSKDGRGENPCKQP